MGVKSPGSLIPVKADSNGKDGKEAGKWTRERAEAL